MAKTEPFEKYSAKYDEWFEKNKPVFNSELLAIKKHLPGKGTGIEIGVGTARFADLLNIKYGVEPSGKMRLIAKSKGVEVVGGIAESLPFGDSLFDYSLMVTVICFLDNLDAAFKEAGRILKPDGQLILGFIDKLSFLGKLYETTKNRNEFYRYATFYSVQDVISCLKRNRFNRFDISQTIFHNPDIIRDNEPIKKGYGQGGFVVINAGR